MRLNVKIKSEEKSRGSEGNNLDWITALHQIRNNSLSSLIINKINEYYMSKRKFSLQDKSDMGYKTALLILRDNTIVTGDIYGVVKRWGLDGTCLNVWKEHFTGDYGHGINAMIELADGTIATASEDATIKNFDPKTNKCIDTWGWFLSRHSDSVRALALCKDGTVVSGSESGEIKRWDPKTGKCIDTWKGQGKRIRILSALTDGSVIAVFGHRIEQWDFINGRLLNSCEDYLKCEFVIIVLHNGMIVTKDSPDTKQSQTSKDQIFSCWDNWDFRKNKKITSWNGSKCRIERLHDGTAIVNSEDYSIKLRLWDVKEGPCFYNGLINTRDDERLFISKWEHTFSRGDVRENTWILPMYDGTVLQSRYSGIGLFDLVCFESTNRVCSVVMLLSALQHNHSIKQADFKGGFLDDYGIDSLLIILTQNKTLEILDICNTTISLAKQCALLETAKKSIPTLEVRCDALLLEQYQKEAEAGDAKAQVILGHIHKDGIAVKKDFTKAAIWYERAALQGNAEAQVEMGLCYRDGRGVTEDHIQAVQWFRKAASQKQKEADSSLAILELKEVLDLLVAAEAGSGKAHYELAMMYVNGINTPKDLTKALAHLEYAAKFNYLPAQQLFQAMRQQEEQQRMDQQKQDILESLLEEAEKGDIKAQCAIVRLCTSEKKSETQSKSAIQTARKAEEFKKTMDLKIALQGISSNQLTRLDVRQIKTNNLSKAPKFVKALDFKKEFSFDCPTVICELSDGTIVGGYGNLIKHWDIKSGKCLGTNYQHFEWNSSNSMEDIISLKDDIVVSADASGVIKSWDYKSNQSLCRWEYEATKSWSRIKLLRLVDESVLIASTNNDDVLSVSTNISKWDPKSGKCLAQWSEPVQGQIKALSLYSDNTVFSISVTEPKKMSKDLDFFKDYTQDYSTVTLTHWDPVKGSVIRTWSYGSTSSDVTLLILKSGIILTTCEIKSKDQKNIIVQNWTKTGKLFGTWSMASGIDPTLITIHKLIALDDYVISFVYIEGEQVKINKWDPYTCQCIGSWSNMEIDLGSAFHLMRNNNALLVGFHYQIAVYEFPPRSLNLIEITSLLNLLHGNVSIQQLDLQNLPIDDSFIPRLFELFERNNALTYLDLRNTQLTSEGCRTLSDRLKKRSVKLKLLCSDEILAFLWSQKAAFVGDAEGQALLGFCYEAGVGVKADILQAIDWYNKSALQGHAQGQFRMGLCCERGLGVPQDFIEAVIWYKKSAAQDDKEAQSALQYPVVKQMQTLLEQAEAGDAKAQFELGSCYETGLKVKKDIEQAQLWYQKAADQDYGPAIASLKLLKDKRSAKASSTDSKEKKNEMNTVQEVAIASSFEIFYSDLKRFEKVGQGGFGVVYRGEWRRTPVAIKELHAINSKESIEEFQREGRIMVGLRHPNIVQFCGYCPDPRCLVMEWMPNGSLYSVLHSDRLLDPTMRYRFVVDIAKGLDFLHACKPPILHRDLKSLNILLDEYFRAKISDFGLSKVKSETRATSTISGGAVGTPAWTAPEMAKRGAEYTPKADIFSFAVVMWEIYTRKVPFADALNPGLVMMWIAQGDREKIPEDCPKKIASLITACWKAKPEERPDASEIVVYLNSSREEFESKSSVSAMASHTASVVSQNSAVYANLESQRSLLDIIV